MTEIAQDPLAGIAFLDDATRPHAPKLEGLTPAQKAAGQHLAMVHDHLRGNMKTLRKLIERAEGGGLDGDTVREETEGMVMIANFRRFGTLCGEHCQIVNMHHSIEDYSLFPLLSAKSEALARVSDRLREEHVVVHELLERLVEALVTLADQPTAQHFVTARTLYSTLETVLLSHLGYEEGEIGDAIGYYGLFD